MGCRRDSLFPLVILGNLMPLPFFFLEVLASSTASSLTGREVQGAIPVSQTVTSLSSGWAHCHKPGYINNAL